MPKQNRDPDTLNGDEDLVNGQVDDQPDASSTPDTSAGTGDNDSTDAPLSTIDVIRSVIRKEAPAEEQTEAPPATDKKEPDAKPDPNTAPVKGAAEEEDKPPPFHEHPRWKQKQQEVVTLRGQVAELEPLAKSQRELDTFIRNNELTVEDTVEALTIAALIRKDPRKAAEALQERLDILMESIGDVLPEDLQQEVDDGLITEARALELSRTRADKVRADAAAKRSEDTVKTTTAATAQATATKVMADAVGAWETEERKRDPAFEKKHPLVLKAVRAVVLEHNVKGKRHFTASEITTILNTARDEVNASLKTMLPEKRPVQAPRTSQSRDTTRVSSGAGGKRQSTLDIVKSRGQATD